jgi:hypothetical protein
LRAVGALASSVASAVLSFVEFLVAKVLLCAAVVLVSTFRVVTTLSSPCKDVVVEHSSAVHLLFGSLGKEIE